MKKLISMIAVFVLAPSLAMASQITASGPFILQGGNILPQNTLDILFSFLPTTGEFDINCDIINHGHSKQYPIVLQLGITAGPVRGGIKLNGKGLGNGQGILTQLSNHLEIIGMQRDISIKDQRLHFQNYDDSDTATVTNCIATYWAGY